MNRSAASRSTFAFGVVGPGSIADVFAAAVAEAGVGHVASVLGRSPQRAQEFARRHGARLVEDLPTLLREDPTGGIDALYVATPHTGHAAIVRSALERGVPVLCEKPLTTDPAETAALYALSAEVETPLMEAWMYRAHPQVAALFDALARGEAGELERIEAEFAFCAPFDAAHRLFAPALGGGAILDVGGYPLSFALGVVRAAQGALLPAHLLQVDGERAPSGVDGEAHAELDVGGVPADLRVSIQREGLEGRVLSRARVIGSEATLALEQPWMPEGDRRGRRGVLTVARGDTVERREVGSERDCFAHEAAAFAALVETRRADPEAPLWPAFPLVDAGESQAIGRLAAAWRAAVLAAEAQPS